MRRNTLTHLQLYFQLGLTPIPLKPRSKEPPVRWRDGWSPTLEELQIWASQSVNWGVRCRKNLAVLDLGSQSAYYCFIREHSLPLGYRTVKKPISPTLPQPRSHGSTDSSAAVQLNTLEQAAVQFQSQSNGVERISVSSRIGLGR